MFSEAAAILNVARASSSHAAAQATQDASHGGFSADMLAPALEDAGARDGLTCAICLDCIDPADLALIPNCEHQYCVNCILHWAVHKEATWCPQCRVPFSQLLTYRKLDGSLRDFPASESVCLLKRTAHFQEYMTAREKGKSPALGAAGDGAIPPEVMDWQDYGRFYDEYDDDEEVENYYFSAAAGRARIILGNRRWGENGFVSSGRMQARPVAPARPAKGDKAGKGSSVGSAGKGGKSTSSAASPAAAPTTPVQSAGRTCSGSAGPHTEARSPHTPARQSAPSGSGPASDAVTKGSSRSRSGGRRALRNARRAAVDARSGGLNFD